MTRLAARAAAALTVLVVAVSAWAAAPEAGPTWDSLNAQQKSVLGPLQRDWSGIDAPRKQKWIEMARRFPSLPEAERSRIQQRMAEWARMTPSERTRARLQFQETRQISAEDRQSRWEAYQALPEEQRRELAQRAKPVARPASASESRTPESVVAKRNEVPVARPAPVKSVAPTLVQAKPGVSTSLLNAKPATPAHQQPGLPKIAGTRDFVDPNTLLPQRGPQGAAVQARATSDANTHR